MKHDFTAFRGDPDKPAAVFIHGLGMDRRIWETPEQSRVLGGRFPVSLLLCREPEAEVREAEAYNSVSMGLSFGRPPEKMRTLFHDLKEYGYSVIAWSQRRPSAETDVAVSELGDVIEAHKEYCKRGIILIGHSRGGLVARKYVAGGDRRVKCLVTLAAPHGGSRMAQWAKYVSPLISLIAPFLPESERGTVTYALKSVFTFLKSRAVRELLPGSLFLRSLANTRCKGVYYLSAGGNDPTLLSVYMTTVERVPSPKGKRFIVRPRRIFSVPDILEKVIPSRLFPDEMRKGKGDGLVATKSSRLPWADAHYDFDVNHAWILFDERVRGRVVDALRAL